MTCATPIRFVWGRRAATATSAAAAGLLVAGVLSSGAAASPSGGAEALRDARGGYSVALPGGTGTTQTKVRVHRARCGSVEQLAVIFSAMHVSPTGLPNIGVSVGSGCRPKGGGLAPSYSISTTGTSGSPEGEVRPGDRIAVRIDVLESGTGTVRIRNATQGWTFKGSGPSGPTDRYRITTLMTWQNTLATATLRKNLVDGRPLAEAGPSTVVPDDACAELGPIERGTDFSMSVVCG